MPAKPDMSHKPLISSPTRSVIEDENGEAVEFDDMSFLPAKSVLENQDRLTAQLNIYYEQCGENPEQVQINFTDFLRQSMDGVYSRRLLLEQDFVELDFGWVKSASLVIISNRAGLGLTSIPTKEEKKAIAKKVIAVSCDGQEDQWFVHPRRFFAGCPASLHSVFLRSLDGKIKANISIIPG